MGIVSGDVAIRLKEGDLIARSNDCFFIRESNAVFQSYASLEDYDRTVGPCGFSLGVRYVGRVSDMKDLNWEEYVPPSNVRSAR